MITMNTKNLLLLASLTLAMPLTAQTPQEDFKREDVYKRQVTHHGHQLAGRLFPTDVIHLVFRLGFGDEVIHTRFFGHVLCRQGIVSRYHHRFDTHFS